MVSVSIVRDCGRAIYLDLRGTFGRENTPGGLRVLRGDPVTALLAAAGRQNGERADALSAAVRVTIRRAATPLFWSDNMKKIRAMALVITVAACSSAEAQSEMPAMASLIAALSHADASVRSRAAERLLQAGSASVRPLIDVVRRGGVQQVTRAASLLLKMEVSESKAEVATALIRLLDDKNTEAWRWQVAGRLLWHFDPQALARRDDLLVQALESESPMRQAAAVAALLEMDDQRPAVVPALTDLLTRPRQPFRRLAIDDRTIDDGLVAITPSFVVWDDQSILRAMIQHGGSEGMEKYLSAHARHPSATARLFAARALVDAGAAENQLKAVRILTSLLCPEISVEHRLQAVSLLASMRSAAAPAVAALARQLRSSSGRLRGATAQALESIGPAAANALPELTRAMEIERALGGDNAELVSLMMRARRAIQGDPEGDDQGERDASIDVRARN